MRAIIDASGLPQAVSYYRMFRREPSRLRRDDMTIDRIIPIHHMTLEKVLDQMLAASPEREVLIVAHGEPKGLIMPLMHPTAPHHYASAIREALDLVSSAGAALDRRAAIRAQPAGDQVASWAAFAEELAPGSVRGAFEVREAEAWFARWLAVQARDLKVGGVHALEHLIRKTNAVRQAQFERVEVRACNLNAEARESLCKFLGAGRVCAPTIGTFYVWVYPFVARSGMVKRWEHVYGGVVHGGVYRHGPGPATQHYDVVVPTHRVPVERLIHQGFRIRVWETSRRPHEYSSRAAALSWSYVKSWVDQHVAPHSRYQRGNFVLAGLWTFGRGGQPFVTPTDQGYRDALACSARGAPGDYPEPLTRQEAFG